MHGKHLLRRGECACSCRVRVVNALSTFKGDAQESHAWCHVQPYGLIRLETHATFSGMTKVVGLIAKTP